MAIASSLKRRDCMEIGKGLEPAKIYYDRIEWSSRAYPGLKRMKTVYQEAFY